MIVRCIKALKGTIKTLLELISKLTILLNWVKYNNFLFNDVTWLVDNVLSLPVHSSHT